MNWWKWWGWCKWCAWICTELVCYHVHSYIRVRSWRFHLFNLLWKYPSIQNYGHLPSNTIEPVCLFFDQRTCHEGDSRHQQTTISHLWNMKFNPSVHMWCNILIKYPQIEAFGEATMPCKFILCSKTFINLSVLIWRQ